MAEKIPLSPQTYIKVEINQSSQVACSSSKENRYTQQSSQSPVIGCTEYVVKTSPAISSNTEVEDVKPKKDMLLGPTSSSSSTSGNQDKISATLLEKELWTEFSQAQNEMIITKVGRNLFPVIKVKVENLRPDETYKVELDICSVDECRYKYHENEWVVAGKAEPLVPSPPYVHPDTPTKGSEIMKQPLSFRKLKITNSSDQKEGFITLNSMHKYLPRAIVSILHMGVFQTVECVTFKETMFYAVTAYQNQKVTQLKIKYNPFAKGFRGSELSSYPRPGVLAYSRFPHFNRHQIGFHMDPTLSATSVFPSPSPPMQNIPYSSPTHKSYVNSMHMQIQNPELQDGHGFYYEPTGIPVTLRNPVGMSNYQSIQAQPHSISYSGLIAAPHGQHYAADSARLYDNIQNAQSMGVQSILPMSVISHPGNPQTQTLQVIQHGQAFPLPLLTQSEMNTQSQAQQQSSFSVPNCTTSSNNGQNY